MGRPRTPGKGMTFELWDCQRRDVDFAFDSVGTPIHASPCGSGKTVIQCEIARREMDRGSYTAILTPRIELFKQTHGTASEICGADNIAELRAEGHWNRNKPIHIVSWTTLTVRSKRSEAWYPDVQRVLVDECHLSMAPQIRRVLEYYRDRGVRIDGYTATPGRKSGKGLGSFYTEIKHVTSVRQLIAEGKLSPLEYWGGALPDVQKIRQRGGDYVVGELSAACAVLVGDVVDNWLRLARQRHTVVFAVDIPHAEMLNDKFLEVGIRSVVVHSRQSDETRAENVRKFRCGDAQVLVNVTIASYGFDCPEVDCIVAARPTKSLVLWLQCLGRGMRCAEGKKQCLVLDHADNTRELGRAEDLYRWRLDEGKEAVENWTKNEQSGEAEEARSHTCEQCQYIFSKSRVCPNCGWEVPFMKRDVKTVDADLVLIGGAEAKRLPKGWPTHQIFYQMLFGHCDELGYQRGWAYHKFKAKCGCAPDRNWIHLAAISPDERVRNYLYYSGKGRKKKTAA